MAANGGRPGVRAMLRAGLVRGRERGARAHPRPVIRLAVFGAIGIACTAAFSLLYVVFRAWMPALAANALALSCTLTVNFLANRWFTFGAHAGSLWRQFAGYLVAYALGMAASTAAFSLALYIAGPSGHQEEMLLALAAGVAATIVRFVLMARWVFRAPAGGHHQSLPIGGHHGSA